jgi:hypothetical protein
MIDKPPYPGQGTAIPASMGKGQWIVESMIYLSEEGEDLGPPGPKGRINLGATIIPRAWKAVYEKAKATLGLARQHRSVKDGHQNVVEPGETRKW